MQISAVLGDMEKTAGTVRVSGSTAYVAQSAWIINDTVRGNITFGKPFNQARYDAVVEATSLEHDFKVQKILFPSPIRITGIQDLAGCIPHASLPGVVSAAPRTCIPCDGAIRLHGVWKAQCMLVDL